MPIGKELATIIELETGAWVIPVQSKLNRENSVCSTGARN